jgi:hypothetical protein
LPWTQHHNKSYYYRKRRVNGHVVSEYVGRSPDAELAAQAVADRAARVAHKRELDQKLGDFGALLDEIEVRLNHIIAAHLFLNGYHIQRGEWRKIRPLRRKQKPADTSAENDANHASATTPS